MRSISVAVTTLALLSLACGDLETSNLAEISFRDSAGIGIAEIPFPTHLVRGAQHVVATDLELLIPPSGSSMWFQKIQGVGIGADGDLFVLDSGRRQVHFFNELGEATATFGSEGSGPHEFRSPVLLRQQTFDSVRVFDHGLGRITVLPTSGLVEAVQVRHVPSPWGNWRAFGFTARSIAFAMSTTPFGIQVGVHSRPTEWRLGTLSEDSIREPWLNIDGAYAVTSVHEGVSSQFEQPFSIEPFFGVGRSSVVVGMPFGEVRSYGVNGSLRSIIRVQSSRGPPQPDDLEAYIQALVDSASHPNLAAAYKRVFSRISLPARFPVIDQVIVASDETIWLRLYAPSINVSNAWLVLAADGRPKTVVDLIPDFRLMQVTDDRLVGVVVNEDQTQGVAIYRRPIF